MALNREEIKKKVFNIIAEQMEIDPEKIKEENDFESLGADSLDRVEFIMKFEEEFDIEIDDSNAEKIKNIEQVIDFLNSKLAETSQKS